MPQVAINNQEHDIPTGGSVLDALRLLGIEVPTLCHDDRLRPTGACRLCSVELEGQDRLVAACTTPLTEGMRIQTHSVAAEADRRTNLTLLAQSYPAGEPLEDHVEFHRYLRQYGITPSGTPAASFKDNMHPYLKVDMGKCVHCYRCIRICDELQGQFVWRAWNRGDKTEIRPDKGLSLMESSCVSCGACADTCPSGAIEDKLVVEKGVPTSWTRTTCPYCGTGCEMEVGVRDNEVVVARPVMDAPVSKGHLCVKGRYAHRFAHAKDRVTSPQIRTDNGWKAVTWDEVYEHIGQRLMNILAESGPSSIGVLGSSRATNEENYLAQKFARVVLGSNNVDCCARVCHAPSAAALKATLGTGASTNSFDDIEIAKGFLVCGANPTENHPIVGARIKQAVLHGAKLVVVDPRVIELARYADVHLQIKPGTNVPVFHAMAHAIIESGDCDEEFVASRTSDFEQFRALVSEWTPERAAEVAGVSAEDIRRAATIYAQTKPSMIFHGLGMTEHMQGTEGVRCLVNLALLTGNLGKPGSGENPLRGQNNVQGSAHMGCEPSNLAGFTPIETGAELVESVWGAPVPREPGMNWMKMLDAAQAGTLRALYAIGYDVYFSNPNAAETAKGLRNLDLLIVQDMFMNETAREFAHVFLPACSSYEKDGTFMNSERRVQRVRQCIPTIGDSKADWEIIGELATHMGFGRHFTYNSPEQIWKEVQSVWKAGSGISYDRIEKSGLQWPCLDQDHPGTTRLHGKSFPIGDRAAFSMIEYIATPEQTNGDFPFLLNTGRTLMQFNAGTMTNRTGNEQLHPTDVLEICAEDAEALNLTEGERVQITSRYGSATLPIRISTTIRRHELFTTFHDPKVFLNRVTSNHRDRVVGAPEYKVTAVRIERLPQPVT
ncbi:MAG: formate dehydrogenase subunit alpha [Armatimonadetes bacterium]|nr:formate dehydrogenase subunit alpha [Armatimonadota bacterium]